VCQHSGTDAEAFQLVAKLGTLAKVRMHKSAITQDQFWHTSTMLVGGAFLHPTWVREVVLKTLINFLKMWIRAVN
jgi:hypothetical protein